MAVEKKMQYKMLSVLRDEAVASPKEWYVMGPVGDERLAQAYSGELPLGSKFFLTLSPMVSVKYRSAIKMDAAIVLTSITERRDTLYLVARPIVGPVVSMTVTEIPDDERMFRCQCVMASGRTIMDKSLPRDYSVRGVYEDLRFVLKDEISKPDGAALRLVLGSSVLPQNINLHQAVFGKGASLKPVGKGGSAKAKAKSGSKSSGKAQGSAKAGPVKRPAMKRPAKR